MFEKLSFTEIDHQNAELLPARTVMSVIMNQSATGSSSNTPGPSDFAKICSQNPQNCDALITAVFNFLFGPPSPQPK